MRLGTLFSERLDPWAASVIIKVQTSKKITGSWRKLARMRHGVARTKADVYLDFIIRTQLGCVSMRAT